MKRKKLKNKICNRVQKKIENRRYSKETKKMLLLLIFGILILIVPLNTSPTDEDEKYISGTNTDASEALKFLQENDKLNRKLTRKMAKAMWNYETNLTEYNEEIQINLTEEDAKIAKEEWKKAISFAWKNFKYTNYTIYKWFKSLATIGSSALSEEKLREMKKIEADLLKIYATAEVCPYNPDTMPCNLTLEPELLDIFRESRDYEELKHAWEAWRDVSGRKMRAKFQKLVELQNEAARLNGFSDAGEYLRESYESDTFENELQTLYQAIRPLYLQVHTFVRRKLIEFYDREEILPDGPIPAHLLGNMWAQKWHNIFDIVKPYPNKTMNDVTKIMQNYSMTILDMVKLAESFFTSIGLYKMTAEFWNNSIFEKPKDREMICHPSAENFFDGQDFRIKMCGEVNAEYFEVMHHEMGHIEYYMHYRDQPIVFQEGANSGFHEAIGDLIGLSVSTQTHLAKINLVKEVNPDQESEINYLMLMALQKIVFLPFAYVMESWRWKVFSRDIQPIELNKKWWEYRLSYQGLCPPVKRSEADLDPAAKYHISNNIPYIRYFFSHLAQFQFHKALCDEAEFKGPLHLCDIYQNKKAGKLLSKMLKFGSSITWQEAMKIITKGNSRLDAQPILEYFDPLLKWLKEQNKDEFLGWRSFDPMICPGAGYFDSQTNTYQTRP